MRTLIVFLLIASLLFYLGSRKVVEIDCQINQTPCPAAIEKEFVDLLGQNLILSRPEQKIPALKATYFQYEKIIIKKQPLDKIIVLITTRQPVVCFLIAGQKLLLDTGARVVREVEINPGLPEIKAVRFQEEKARQAIETAALLEHYQIDFLNLELNEKDELKVRLTESEVWLSFEEIGSQIASLQTILSQARIKERLPKKIDLRFNKPILSY